MSIRPEIHAQFNKLVDDVVALGRQEGRLAELQLAFVSGLLVAALLAILIFGSTAAHAGAQEDIAAEMANGNWQHADARLEVLAKHHDHSLAHYWLAQVRLQEGQAASAREHLATAKRLDPDGKFVSRPEVLAQLEAGIAEQSASVPVSSAPISVSITSSPGRTDMVVAVDDDSAQWILAGLFAAGFLVSALVLVAIVRYLGRRGDALGPQRPASSQETFSRSSAVETKRNALQVERDEESEFQARRAEQARISGQIRRRVQAYASPPPPAPPRFTGRRYATDNAPPVSDDGFVAGVMVGQLMGSGQTTSPARTESPSASSFVAVDTGGSSRDSTPDVDTGGVASVSGSMD